MRAATALAALILASCTAGSGPDSASDAGELARALEGRVAGVAQRCLPATQNSGPQIIGETLLYRQGRTLWRAELPDGCPSLRGDPILVTEIFGGSICRNDRFRTIDRGAPAIPGPSCRFGDFTPYVKPAS